MKIKNLHDMIAYFADIPLTLNMQHYTWEKLNCSLEMESLLGRYDDDEGEGASAGSGGQAVGGPDVGVSISVCVNSVPDQTSTLLTVSDRRIPHQRYVDQI